MTNPSGHDLDTYHARDGDRLTSSTHGFRLSSTKISNPYNSEKEEQKMD